LLLRVGSAAQASPAEIQAGQPRDGGRYDKERQLGR
jgi:hypothetical protein